MVRKLLWVLTYLLFSAACQGKPPGVPVLSQEVKILFIGNSLTYFNNMPLMFANLAKASGKEVYVDQATLAGMPLRQLVYDQSVVSKINEKAWDYIVLQSDDITAFPDMYSTEIETLMAVKHIINQNNPSSRIIYTMIWGLRDGVTLKELSGQIVHYSYKEYMIKIYEGTLNVANSTNLMIAPVGWGWYSAILDDEGNKSLLFYSDGAHPSSHGSYLMACIMNAVIFQNSDTDISFYSDIPMERAIYYQQKAVSTVFNSLDLWNITPISSGKIADNLYHRPGFEIYRIYPNPLTESTQIGFCIDKADCVSLCIYDYHGKMIDTVINGPLGPGDHTVRFDAGYLSAGLYYVHLTCGNRTKYEKIVIVK
jgi:hypothetical protein